MRIFLLLYLYFTKLSIIEQKCTSTRHHPFWCFVFVHFASDNYLTFFLMTSNNWYIKDGQKQFFLFNFESFLTILEWNPLPISLSLLLNAISSSVEIFLYERNHIHCDTDPIALGSFYCSFKAKSNHKKRKKKGRGPGCKKTANLIKGPHSKIVYSQDFVTRALLINSKIPYNNQGQHLFLFTLFSLFIYSLIFVSMSVSHLFLTFNFFFYSIN